MILSINRFDIAAAVVSITAVAALVSLSIYFDVSVLYYVTILSFGTAMQFILLRKFGAQIVSTTSRPAVVKETISNSPNENIPSLNIRLFWAVALLLHGIAIFGGALYEDDYFRFIWDGWQTLQGTPYGKAPELFYTDDNVPGHLWPVLDNINNPSVPTIYGPTLQAIFAFTYLWAGSDPMGLRIIFAIINLILIVILSRRYPLHQVALYAWCPLVVTEIIIHIHPDGILAACLAAGLWLYKKNPIMAGILWGAAAGSKIIALAAWPLMLRWPKKALIAAIMTLAVLYGYFAFIGDSLGFESTATFAGEWYFNPMAFYMLSWIAPQNIARILAACIGIIIIMLIHARTRDKDFPPLAAIFGIILLFAPAVNSWYMIWILPFAIASRQIWPFVAAIFIPFSYITGLTLDTEALLPFEVHPLAQSIEYIAIIAALLYDYRNARRQDNKASSALTMINNPNIAVIIPALNEAQSIGEVVTSLRDLPAINSPKPPMIIVVDNGSDDGTADIATQAGAKIVYENERGYGAACLAGIAALPDEVNIILFMDADGSDVPEEAIDLIAPIHLGQADMVIGSRSLGHIEAGAMTPPQRFGNWLSTRLVKLIWQKEITDLGPFRAIRRDALEQLEMADRDFGWTIEMQVKAIQHDMRVLERPANYRKRIGISKISGTIGGVWGAGTKILYVIAREAYFR